MEKGYNEGILLYQPSACSSTLCNTPINLGLILNSCGSINSRKSSIVTLFHTIVILPLTTEWISSFMSCLTSASRHALQYTLLAFVAPLSDAMKASLQALSETQGDQQNVLSTMFSWVCLWGLGRYGKGEKK